MRFSLACAVLVSLVLASAPSGAQQIDPQPPATPSIQGYGDGDKTCLAWTDQCRTCTRDADGTVHCSNIGVACQPAAIACTRREEPAKKPE